MYEEGNQETTSGKPEDQVKCKDCVVSDVINVLSEGAAITITPFDITTSPLPFAVSLRAALSHCSSALIAVSDNINNLPLPDAVPSKPSVPELTDVDVRACASPVPKSTLPSLLTLLVGWMSLALPPSLSVCSHAIHVHSWCYSG